MDFLSDMITSIRNGQQVGLREIVYNLPKNEKNIISDTKNSFLVQVLDILHREGFIRGFTFNNVISKEGFKSKNSVIIFLKYDAFGQKVIRSIIQVSTPGRRVYLSTKSL